MDTQNLAIGLVSAVLAAKIIWELYLSPVARQHIPGPKRAAVSDLWQYWLQFRRHRTLTFHRLFEHYGPIVRVGPNRVLFRNIDTVQAIYSTHDFRKSSWYSTINFSGAQNTLSTGDPDYHTLCRRISAPAFRGDNLRAAGTSLLHEMDVFVDRLRRDCAGGASVEVRHLFPLLTLDVLGLTILGVRFNQIATGEEHVFEKYLQSWIADKLLVGLLPRAVATIIRELPIPQLQKIVTADAIMSKYVEGLYEKVDEKSLRGCSNMLETYKAYRDPDTGKPAPVPMVISDLGMHIVAGIETSAISLVYIAYNLALYENMWRIIRAEVDTVDFLAEDFVDTLRALPYMNAFIREILRVHGPTSIYLERIVPAGGAMLDGYFIPEGTEVGGLAYTSHFNERVFPRPHQVDPLRWVQLDEATGQHINREDIPKEMNDNWFPFGVGVRSCAGRALADLELGLVTATIVKNFRVLLHETTTPDSMSPMELGTLKPKAGRCLLRFDYTPSAAR